MKLENILWRVEGGIGIATVNRPAALNALDSRTVGELSRLLDAVAEDRGVRALVLTGAGDRAFVAGADIGEMSRLTAMEARRFAEAGQRAFAQLEALSIPTIAAVNGFALGGGCELALACDLVYASEKARFGQPEVNLGLIPGFGGTQRLARRVGLMRAKELVFTGEPIGAAQARALGLCLEVLTPEGLLAHAIGQAGKIASRGQLAVAAAKRAMEAGAGMSLASGCALELEAFALLFSTEDAREGLEAFLEKRAPVFKGEQTGDHPR
jgi:enoyl-CoA hydratase